MTTIIARLGASGALLMLLSMPCAPVALAADAGMPPGSAHSPDQPMDPVMRAGFEPEPILPVPERSNDLPILTDVPHQPAIPVPQARPPHGLDQPALDAESVAEETDDLWDHIRRGFALSDLEGHLVEKHEDWYAERPDYVGRMIDRSRKYLYYIVGEIEKRGMPMEIALLPMIESAYNPTAYSRMKAAGMWQFIPSTGKHYGLKQNFWYDGRRDVLAATHAALDYLQRLHDMFNDWQLALAAYNWGEGAVSRAIARNRAAGKPTGYAHLTMPAETRNYLPKLQAVKNLVADPESFGFELRPIPNEPYFRTVKLPGQMDVKVAAKLANLSVDEFRTLNPAHSRPVIVPTAARQLLLPADKVDVFHENLENFDRPLVTWQSYRVQRKERLRHVASKFGLTVAQLCDANGLSARARLRPGQMLLVPARNPTHQTTVPANADHADFAPARGKVAQRAPVPRHYKVRRGETLFAIARKHAISVAQIKTWNRLRGNTVKVGQVLVVKAPERARTLRAQKVALR